MSWYREEWEELDAARRKDPDSIFLDVNPSRGEAILSVTMSNLPAFYFAQAPLSVGGTRYIYEYPSYELAGWLWEDEPPSVHEDQIWWVF